jgi:hypothetical protein
MVIIVLNTSLPSGSTAVQGSGHVQIGQDSPPCIAARRGGRAIKKYREASAFREDGVVFPIDSTRNTTPAASIRTLRDIPLMTQPPLLAVMRGGESPLQKAAQNSSDLFRPHWTSVYASPSQYPLRRRNLRVLHARRDVQSAGGGLENRLRDVVLVAAVQVLDVEIESSFLDEGLQKFFDQFRL